MVLEKNFIFYMAVCLGIVTAVSIAIILNDAYNRGITAAQKRERLMKQCMDDGRKEYECIGLLKGKV